MEFLEGKSAGEYLASGPGTLSERVERVFGRAPRSMVRAVAGYLERRPGSLDDAHLELIGHSTEAIGDPQLVARLIEQMPVTGMNVAVSKPDALMTELYLRVALHRYPPVVRQRLVLDLVSQSALEAARLVPPERLTTPARALLDGFLERMSRGSIHDMATAALSSVATPKSIDDVLVELERRIDRAEAGTATRPPGKMPFGSVGDVLLGVIDSRSDGPSPEQVKKAWQLAVRCEHSDGGWKRLLLTRAVGRKELVEAFAEQILDEMDTISALERHNMEVLRGLLIAWEELPENLAARAVRSGAFLAVEKKPLALLRQTTYFTYSTTTFDSAYPIAEKSTEYLPEPMTTEEAERRLAEGTDLAHLRDPQLVGEMTSPVALGILARRMADENPHVPTLEALAVHPAVRPEDVAYFAERVGEQPPQAQGRAMSKYGPVHPGSEPSSTRLTALALHHPKVDVATVAGALANADREQRRRLVGFVSDNAVQHGNSELIEFLIDELAVDPDLDEPNRELGIAVLWRLGHLARATTSVSHQQKLVELAVRFEDERLARSVFLNSMTPNDVVTRLRSTFETDTWHPSVISSTYSACDVARRTIDGEARPEVVLALVHGSLGYRRQTSIEDREDCHRAVEILIDNDLVQPEQWRELTMHPDAHVAYRYASHPRCPADMTGMAGRSTWQLEQTTVASRRRIGQWPAPRPSLAWDDLPNMSDEQLPINDLATRIDGREVAGFTLHTPRTSRELTAAGRRMGNCIAGFEHLVRDGSAVVAWTTRDTNRLAVVWDVDAGNRLRLYEVNTAYNTNDVPQDFRQGIDGLTDEVNRDIASIGERRLAQPVVEPDHEVEELDVDDIAHEFPEDGYLAVLGLDHLTAPEQSHETEPASVEATDVATEQTERGAAPHPTSTDRPAEVEGSSSDRVAPKRRKAIWLLTATAEGSDVEAEQRELTPAPSILGDPSQETEVASSDVDVDQAGTVAVETTAPDSPSSKGDDSRQIGF